LTLQPLEGLDTDSKVCILIGRKMKSITLQIEGMSCASCVGHVEKTLMGISGIASASVDLANGTASISFNSPVSIPTVTEALANAGYPAKVKSHELPNKEDRIVKKSAILDG
jgi:copper chaperone CopZ